MLFGDVCYMLGGKVCCLLRGEVWWLAATVVSLKSLLPVSHCPS